MKRFYTDVGVVERAEGFAIELDGRPVRTPARALLALPTPALAQAVAAKPPENSPTAQAGQDVAPKSLWKRPGLQETQARWPSLAAWRPRSGSDLAV